MRWETMTALVVTLVILGALAHAATETRRTVIHVRGEADHLICAEYDSAATPRQPNRACLEASVIRDWILRNAPDGQCH